MSDDWNLKSTTLDVIESNGKHAAIVIAHLFKKSLDKFDIIHKIMGITVIQVAELPARAASTKRVMCCRPALTLGA